MKNKQLIILFSMYAIAMGFSYSVLNDPVKIQTFAIVVSGLILIWYSWETRLLRILALEQKDLQIQPLVIYENFNNEHNIKNIGNSVALNIQINKVMVGGSDDIEVNFPEFISVLHPKDSKTIKGEFRLNGVQLSDDHSKAHLSTRYSNQTSKMSITYSNIQNIKYLTEVEVSPGKIKILKTQKVN